MVDSDFDIVVAGGGPAGSSLALRLARAGYSVAVLEAKRFPRRKPCGEYLTPESARILAELGLRDAVERAGARPVRGMKLFGHGHAPLGRYGPVGEARAFLGHGWAIPRERLDAILLDAARAAGVAVFEETTVASLERAPGGAVKGVETRRKGERLRVRGRFTVGADGLRSRVAKELDASEAIPWLDKLAFVARYEGVTWGDFAEVHFLDDGYFACAPVGDGLVTLNHVIDRPLFLAARRPSTEFLERRLTHVPELAARLTAGRRVGPVLGAGPLATRARAPIFDGAALVGDACGYVDPVTGEGVFYALRGAELLAESLTRALEAGRQDRASLMSYRRARTREFAPRRALALTLQRGLRHPALVRAGLARLEAHPRWMDLLIAVAGDYVPLRELARPSVWWHFFGPRGAAIRA